MSVIDVDEWPAVLANVTGTIVNGEERISTAEALRHVGGDALVTISDENAAWNLLKQVMNGLGWRGPKTMRIRGRAVKGYGRHPAPRAEQQRADEDHAAPSEAAADHPVPASREPAEVQPRSEIKLPDRIMSDELAAKLEQATMLGLEKLEDILRRPTDDHNGNLLRAQTAAAGIAVNSQLRADENKLRAKRDSGVFDRLLMEVKKQRRLLRRAPPPENYLLDEEPESGPVIEGAANETQP
jgi:hypothetical protein